MTYLKNTTIQGNTFNGAGQLAKYDSSGNLVLTATGVATNAAGNYTPLVVDSSGNLKLQPASASLSALIIDNTLTTPPASPNVGDTYLVPATGATGAWAGNANSIASWNGSAWGFIAPATNNYTEVGSGTNAGKTYMYDGSGWNFTPIPATGGTTIQSITSTATLTSTTLAGWQRTLLCNVSGGILSITLPAVGATNIGQVIEIKKTDSSTNYIKVIPNGSNILEGGASSNAFYIYSQNDAITLRSDGSNSVWVMAMERGNINASKGYLSATAVSNYTATTYVVFESATAQSYGSSITLQSGTTGVFTLQAGRTYKLVGSATSASGEVVYQWYNITGSAYIGNAGDIGGTGKGTTALAIISPTQTTQVGLKVISGNSNTITGTGEATYQRGPYAYIEELSTPANIINTVQYCTAKLPSNQTLTLSVTTTINFAYVNGGIPLTSGVFTLTAGVTYYLHTALNSLTTSVNYGVYYWVDATSGTQLSGTNRGFWIGNDGGGSSPCTNTFAEGIYTPTTNQTIKAVVTAAGSSTITLDSTTSIATIVQIGSTGYPQNQDGSIGATLYSGTTSTSATSPELNTGKIWGATGKAIYRKCYSLSNIVTNTILDNFFATGNIGTNYTAILSIVGTVYVSASSFIIPLPFDDGTNIFRVYTDNGGLKYGGTATATGLYFYIEYTK